MNYGQQLQQQAAQIGSAAVAQPLTVLIHDEIGRIQDSLSHLEGALHGGPLAQLPQSPVNNQATPAPAPSLRTTLQAAHDRLLGIRARIEALAGASATF